MYNKSPLSFCLKAVICSLAILNILNINTAKAENLLETYQQAAKNDPEWLASQDALAANKKFKEIGRSGLLPRIMGSVRYQRSDNDSAGVPTGINPDFGSTLGIASCALEDLINDDSESASSCLLAFENIDVLSNFYQCVQNNGGDDTNCYFTTTRDQSTSSTTNTSIQLTQPLFHLGRWFDYRKSINQVAKALSEFESARQDLVLKVAETYFNDLKAIEETEFAKLEKQAIEYQLKITEKRFRRGIGSSLEVYEAQSVFDLNEASKLLVDSIRENAHDDLELLTRNNQIEADPLPEDIPIESPVPNKVETWVTISKNNSSDLRAAEFAALIAKQDYRKKRAAHSPTLDLGLSFSQLDNGQETFVTASGKTTTTAIGLTLNVPIYSGGLSTAMETQAKHRQREAERRLEQTRQEIAGSTRKLFRQVKSAVLRVKANKVAIVSSDKTLKATQRGYERGIRTVSELLQAQRDVFRAKKNYSSARYDYILDTLRLKRISGMLSEQDLDVLNTWLEKVEVNEDGSVSASSLNPNLPISGTVEDAELERREKQRYKKRLERKSKPKPKSLFEALKSWGAKKD
ncbi:MAG: TolC family outer membrane protein [Pseudomonadales bacterium]|nr:TolC family outer membrane protein [Pseudomonadales bacterium]